MLDEHKMGSSHAPYALRQRLTFFGQVPGAADSPGRGNNL